MIKSYVLDFGIRPVTAFDADWKNSCLMCTELPTIANGLAKFEDRGDGRGMAVTIKLKPGPEMGRRRAGHHQGPGIHLEGRPRSGLGLVQQRSLGPRHQSMDIIDDHTAVLHLGSVMVSYNQWDILLPEHIEAPVLREGGQHRPTTSSRPPSTARRPRRGCGTARTG